MISVAAPLADPVAGRARLTGLAWDHPRAYRPLEAFGAGVDWDRQSLEDFEARPIAELARRYDLLVIDHPGLGAAIAAGALLPLDDVVDADTRRLWRAASVARTWDSYQIGEQTWAVPIDAATQVTLLRRDRVEQPPASWSDVVQVTREVPTTLCLGGPHALLSLLALCASAGVDPVGQLVDPRTAVEAIAVLQEVWAHSDQRLGLGNPIDVHEAMAGSTAGPALCPLVYGYAAYARPVAGKYPLAWADAPTFGSNQTLGSGSAVVREATRPGSVLGGTGLAVSALSGADLDEVRAWLTGFLQPAVQTDLVPSHAGQPAARAAWDSPCLDAEWNGYYSATRRSLERAHIRPRIDGWIPVQNEASALVRDCVTSGADPARTVTIINGRYRSLTDTLARGETR